MPDLFGHEIVSIRDIIAWTQAVPAHPHAPGSAHWVQYVRGWNVLDKVAHAKRAGTFDSQTANCPHISDDDIRAATAALKPLITARKDLPARAPAPPLKKRKPAAARVPLPSEIFAPLPIETILPAPAKSPATPTPPATAARSATVITLPAPAKSSATPRSRSEPLRARDRADAINIAPHLSAKATRDPAPRATPRTAAKPAKIAAASSR